MEVDVNEENIGSWMESVLPEVWWCFWRWSRRLGKKKKKKKKTRRPETSGRDGLHVTQYHCFRSNRIHQLNAPKELQTMKECLS